MELTIREKIIELLTTSKKPLSAYQIASLLGLEKGEERRIYEEIAHASRSLRRRSGGRLTIVMIPPQCANCGYVFKDLKRPRKPSRCPRCKSERIYPPLFTVIEL